MEPQAPQDWSMSIGEHRRASALLRNIRNIRILYEKKKTYRFCNLRKWKDFNKKNSLPYLKCVLRLSYVVHGPIYGRFMGFYVNGFLSDITGGRERKPVT